MIQSFYKNLLYIGLFFLIFIIQKSFTVLGSSLPLSLCFAVTVALVGGKYESIIWGALCGLAVDISAGFPAGQNALIYVVISACVSFLARVFQLRSWYIIFGVFAACSLVYNIYMCIITAVNGNVGSWLNIFIIDIALTALCGSVLYYIGRRIYDWTK